MRMKIKRFELVRDSADDEYYKLLYYIIEDNFFEHLTVDLCVDCFLQLDEYDNCVGWFYKEPGRHGKIIAVFSINGKRPDPSRKFLLCIWDSCNPDVVCAKFLDSEEAIRIAEDAHPKKA